MAGQTHKTPKERRKMWLIFLEHRTILAVTKQCKIAKATALRYQEIDNWDDRAAEIDRVISSLDRDQAIRRRQDHIGIARTAVEQMVKDLERRGKLPRKRVAFNVQDFDRIVRLIEFLSGEKESSHGIGDDSEKEELRRFIDGYTDDQQAAIIRNIRAEEEGVRGDAAQPDRES